MTYADVAEGVRATIAAYTHALDDGRTDDVVATFCADGVVDIPGMGTHEGHDARLDDHRGQAAEEERRIERGGARPPDCGAYARGLGWCMF